VLLWKSVHGMAERHSSGSAEGVASNDGHTDRHGNCSGRRNHLHLIRQARKIVGAHPQKLEVEQKLLHRGVAHALADAKFHAVEPSGASLDRRQTFCGTGTPVSTSGKDLLPVRMDIL